MNDVCSSTDTVQRLGPKRRRIREGEYVNMEVAEEEMIIAHADDDEYDIIGSAPEYTISSQEWEIIMSEG